MVDQQNKIIDSFITLIRIFFINIAMLGKISILCIEQKHISHFGCTNIIFSDCTARVDQ